VGRAYILEKKESPEDALISKEISERIQEAAEGLHDRLRIPLYMYYTAEMSNEEIASALKIPKGTVKSRLHKAHKILKDVLEDYVYEES
jgi:RNA polymerase sigma-70 factor (ECF subfamily)